MTGAAAIVVLCYLLGSIPFPVLISRLAMGVDLREHGSGNMGAMNAARVLGRRWFPLVFGLDFAKGAVATYMGRELIASWTGIDPLLGAAIGGLVAVVGHCFPVFVGFKGGVGLASTAGALALVSWPLVLSAATAIALFWALARDMYVGVAAASLIYPLLGWYWLRSGPVTLVLAMWGLVVFFLHLGDVKAWVTVRKNA